MTAAIQGAFPGLPKAKRAARPVLVAVRRTGVPTWLLPRGSATEAELCALVEEAGATWTPGGTEGLSVAHRAADDVIAAAEYRRWIVKVIKR
jgi:hypothetical protein